MYIGTYLHRTHVHFADKETQLPRCVCPVSRGSELLVPGCSCGKERPGCPKPRSLERTARPASLRLYWCDRGCFPDAAF